MELHLTADQEIAIAEIAAHAGQDPQSYAQELLEWHIAVESEFWQRTKEAEAQLDRGEHLTSDQTRQRLARWNVK